jgi:hypothetical protein
MWCLETIVAINNELATGKTLDQAYEACGITKSVRSVNKHTPKEKEQDAQWGMQKPPLKAAG